MIRRFRHRGLRRLYEDDDRREALDAERCVVVLIRWQSCVKSEPDGATSTDQTLSSQLYDRNEGRHHLRDSRQHDCLGNEEHDSCRHRKVARLARAATIGVEIEIIWWSTMKRLLALLLLLAPCLLRAQVAVAPLEIPRAQFLNSAGQPLAGGCVNFFTTGTSTPQAIYADSGGVNQLSNPLTLDAAGEASVWMSNIGYDIVMNTGVVGTSCSVSLGTQLWKEINKNPFAIINNGSNFIVASGTSDPSGVPGELAYRTDIPCFRGFTTIWDCFVTLTAVQTLTNKTLVNPVIPSSTGAVLTQPVINGLTIGGVTVATGNPTNFATFTNGAAGTTLNQLAKLVTLGAGATAVSTAITDTTGVIGIPIAGAGGSGAVIIQQSGQVLCVFDGSTTVRDYVQISSTLPGNCHDTGSTTPPTVGGDVIGRVLTTNIGVGTYLIDLFPHEIYTGTLGSTVGCTNFTPVPVTNNNAQQNLQSCTIAANTLAQGSLLNVEITGLESTAAGQSTVYSISLGGGTACQSEPAQGSANNQPFNIVAKLFVITSGAGGTANWSCEYFSTSGGGGAVGPFGVIGAPTIAINTTISNTLQVTVQMSVANAGNSVTEQGLKAVVF